MNVNDMIIRPLLGFASTMSLFLIPMITMRLIAEEKKTGTIELLLTSPVKDIEIILGKWSARRAAVPVRAGHVGAQYRACCSPGASRIWRPVLVAYLGLILQGGCLLAIGEFISTLTKNQIIAGGVTFFVCLLLWLLSWSTAFDSGAHVAGGQLPVDRHSLREFRQGRAGRQGRGLLSVHDFLLVVHNFAIHGIAAVEELTWRLNG